MGGRADGAEEGAFARTLFAAQNRSAGAVLVVGNPPLSKRKALLGVEVRPFVAKFQRRMRYDSESPPFERFAKREDLVRQNLRRAVAFFRDGSETSMRIASIMSAGSKPATTTGMRNSSAKGR